jgi:hypothetical protein
MAKTSINSVQGATFNVRRATSKNEGRESHAPNPSCFSVSQFSIGTSIFDARLGLAEEAAEAWQRHVAQ